MLVWGIHMSIDPAAYPQALRTEVELHLRRAKAYVSKRAVPPFPEGEMIQSAQVNYERRLAAVSDDSRAPQLAVAYIDGLRPCYEWEGFHHCPEREAEFADEYLAANPDGPFSTSLPLLAAHRRLCAAEAYRTTSKRLRMLNAAGASTSRDSRPHRNRESCLIRAAAERFGVVDDAVRAVEPKRSMKCSAIFAHSAFTS